MADQSPKPDVLVGAACPDTVNIEVRLDPRRGWTPVEPLPEGFERCWFSTPFVTQEGKYYVRLERGAPWVR